MIGAIEAFMTADHVRLDLLLRKAERDDGTIDSAAYASFRAGLLRHIGMEEKVLIPFARTKRGGRPLEVARALREDHGRIAKLLVPTPDGAVCDELRALLAAHNPLEEGRDGLYATCDALAADDAEATAVVARLRSFPAVPVARHYDGPLLRHDREQRSRRPAPPASARDPRSVIERVKREHAMIRTLLDVVDRTCSAAKERSAGGLDSLRRAVWDLYIAFEEHLAMEDAELAPIVRRSAAGQASAVDLVVEHDEQRRTLLAVVEDTECDMKDADVLADEVSALVRSIRADMACEDQMLASLGCVAELRGAP